MTASIDDADFYLIPADMRILTGAHCAGVEDYAIAGPVGAGEVIALEDDCGPLGWVAVLDGRKIAGGIVSGRLGGLSLPPADTASG
jgi:hypothetical protein